jgi:predicted transcriptional regulator
MDKKYGKNKIVVKIGAAEQMDNEIMDVLNNPKKAEEKPEHTIYLTPEQFQQHLSKEKLKLLHMIREDDCTVSKLAKLLDRKIENVSRDLKDLECIGFIEVKKHGREKYPTANRQIMITI